MCKRICPECGNEFEANGHRGPTRTFCSNACKTTHSNRRTVRGKSLVAIAQAWRKSRGAGEAGKFFFAELTSMLDQFNAEDAEAGRMDAVDYAKLLCDFHPVNPDYHGGRTFEASRWMDRMERR